MTRHKTYTPPTSVVAQEIREILMVNNDLTVEKFHKVKPDDSFIWWLMRSVVYPSDTLQL